MKWSIVTDSSCDLVKSDIDCEAFNFSTVPFTIRIAGTAYEDHEQLDTLALLDAMDICPQIGSTACSPPHTWAEEFKKAENTISVTISCNLSAAITVPQAPNSLYSPRSHTERFPFSFLSRPALPPHF